MQATSRLRLAPEWDGRFTRMVGLSFVCHVSIVVLAIVLTARSGPRPLPMTAYTVEITDPSALGGRLPPGKISTQPSPEASAPAPPPGEPAAEAQPSVPEPPPAPPAPEPEPVAKVEPPKPEPPKADAVKIEPAKKPEPPKPPPKPAAKPEPKPTPPKPVAEKPKPAPEKPKAEKPTDKPTDKPAEKPKPAAVEKPADKPPQAAKQAGQGGPADADAAPKDAYSAAAERWRTKAQGQGLGGTDGGSGPIGAGGAGPGGGGQLVGIEFMAYRQQVITTVKGHWTNVVATPGLVAAVRFQIGADGSLAGIRLERSSGNSAYDSSALRAVQRTEQLPPPPAKYAKEFNEFVIEFHSEETGGKGSG